MRNKCYLICLCFILLSKAYAQELSGRVLDKNTSKGLMVNLQINQQSFKTDSNGYFTAKKLLFPLKITIKNLGYLPVDTVIDKQGGTIILMMNTTVTQLNEVFVSNGYQQINKERLTGSVSHIDQAALQNQVGVNIIDRLEGLANGLIVNRTTAPGGIAIRGLSSINGPKGVLIILDNFPYDGELSSINPNDIESVTILKDAAATSLWGARAGNGVIVLTTKSGKNNTPLQLQAQSTVSLSQQPNLFKTKPISSSDFIDVELMLFEKGFYQTAFNSTERPPLTPVIELMFDPSLVPQQKQGLINLWRGTDVRNDFNKYVYQTGINQQYSLQASAGAEKYNWLASMGFDSNKDELAAKYDRFTLRYALSTTLLKQIKLTVGLQYIHSLTKSGKEGYLDVVPFKGTLYPYAALADENGEALPIARDYRLSYLAGLDQRVLDWKYYPLTNHLHQGVENAADDFNMNTSLNYNLKDFKFSMLYRLQRQLNNRNQLQGLESYEARHLINSFTQLTPANITYNLPLGSINTITASSLLAQDIRLQTNYQKKIGAHEINSFLSFEVRELQRKAQQNTNYGYDENTLISSPVDYVNVYPNLVTGGNGYIPNGQYETATTNRYVSSLGNLSYSFNNTYFAYASARIDASNLFGVSANDRWKPLWSVGLGWLVHKQWNLPAIVEFMKIRASYGFSGNADPNRSGLTTINYRSVSPYTNNLYASISQFYNPDLKWETVRTSNIGVDLKLFGQRLNISIDYYQKKGTDLFSAYPVDYTSGVGATVVKNIASMASNGFDLSIERKHVQTKLWSWHTVLNLSTNYEKITKYYTTATKGNDYIKNATITGLIGKPVYAVFSYPSLGLDAVGDPVGFLQNLPSKDYSEILSAKTSINDLKYHGSALPTTFGNLLNQFSFRSFSLEVAINYKLGYFFRRNSIDYTNLVGSNRGHADFALRWQKAGDEIKTNVPAFQYPVNSTRNLFYQNSEVLVTKADHFRIQYINLAWEPKLPPRLKQLKSLRIFLNASNLGLIWAANDKGIDPDYIQGVSPPAIHSIGINLKF